VELVAVVVQVGGVRPAGGTDDREIVPYVYRAVGAGGVLPSVKLVLLAVIVNGSAPTTAFPET
jgi:hypothetical protein